MKRRDLLAGAATLPFLAALPKSVRAESRGKPWDRHNNALIMDAMGELREVYEDSLIQEMLDSGIRSMTVTVADPKAQEQAAFDETVKGILYYNQFLDKKARYYSRSTDVAGINKARADNKMAVFYLAQNSTQFQRNLDNVDVFFALGLRASQITYNYQNWAGAGCKERNGSGLTVFGTELVEKMNDVGMMIDLSHANEKTTTDTIAASNKPVMISHACCQALYNHERNVSDHNLKALADQGGLFGVTQMRPFMTLQVSNAVSVYFDHIIHAINVCGINSVCIGSDRDHRRLVLSKAYIAELESEEGSQAIASDYPYYFEELNGPRRMEVIWDSLKARGLSESHLEKVMGQNLYDFYKNNIG
jgi:membrane dipeptidase